MYACILLYIDKIHVTYIYITTCVKEIVKLSHFFGLYKGTLGLGRVNM